MEFFFEVHYGPRKEELLPLRTGGVHLLESTVLQHKIPTAGSESIQLMVAKNHIGRGQKLLRKHNGEKPFRQP